MAPKLYVFYGSPAVGSVLITADALGISLDIKELDYFKGEHMNPEYLKINPQHTVPTLVDDDGFAIWDSHAINAYLVRKYGKDDSLYPKDFRKRAIVDNRLHFESGSLCPLLKTVDLLYINKQIKEVPAHMVQDIKNSYDFLEKFLEGHNWVAGDVPTIADFQILSTTSCLDYHVKVDSNTHPNITAWIKRTEAHPWFASHSKTKHCFTAAIESIMCKV